MLVSVDHVGILFFFPRCSHHREQSQGVQDPAAPEPARAIGIGLRKSSWSLLGGKRMIKRRQFLIGSLAFTVGGAQVLLTAREARAQGVPFGLLKADEAESIEALGETLVPGARAAGIAHFIDHQ